ncbi:MAG: homoserine dehydrogenase [Bacteroidales bacterium]|jgi:homoserine dehydrogenase|nr:homoserine dehydrogenase [Bacteroidales bacterium]
MKPEIKIGLFGYGVVGESLYHVLQHSKTVDATVKKIGVKQKDKKRSLPLSNYTFAKEDIIEDEEINLVVELIDDAGEARDIVKKCLIRKKAVVSGNKKMLAHHLDELIELQQQTGTALLYEASACGSIPVIRNIEEYYDNDLLQSVTGILNGSSNYILSRIFKDGMDYHTALKQAQALGFAESNPSLDVDGLDALYKLVIIATHALGTYVHPGKVFHYGISTIREEDIRYACEKNLKIKLVAQLLKTGSRSFTLFVLPRLVNPDKYIYNVEDEYNGVVIEGEFYDKQFMFGKGAGGYPTGSAVLSDITARSHNYRYEYKKQKYFQKVHYTTDHELEIYLRYHNPVDLSYFDFEEITKKYSGKDSNYVVGRIMLKNLVKIKEILPRLNLFLASLKN